MPSPFPGMNPYLERPHSWADFHTTYTTHFRSALTKQLTPKYFAHIHCRLYPSTAPKRERQRFAYIEVEDCSDHKLVETVTVIEFLCPFNKAFGEDRENYLEKRRDLFATRVNFVELDFLRGGPRLPLKDLPDCSYYAMASRPATRPTPDICPVKLRDPLPSIPIPLRDGEPEPIVDLQAVLHKVYDGAGYAHRIYKYEPEPKLSPADADWATAILAAAPKA